MTQLLQSIRRDIRSRPATLAATFLLTGAAAFFVLVLLAVADAGWRRPFELPDPGAIRAVAVLNSTAKSTTYNIPTGLLDEGEVGSSGLLIGSYSPSSGSVQVGSNTRLAFAASVSPELARMVGFVGGGAERVEGVIISEDLWKKRLGIDVPAVGGAILFNGHSYEVLGHRTGHFPLPGVTGVPFVVVERLDTLVAEGRDARRVRMLSRLAEGMSDQSAKSLLSAQAATRQEALSIDLWSLDKTINLVMPGLGALTNLGVCLVSLALTSFAYLAFVAAGRQRREWTIRLVLGQSKGSIIGSAAALSGLYAGAGALLGSVAAGRFVRATAEDWVAGFVLPRAPHVEGLWAPVVITCAIIVVAIITALASGLEVRQAARHGQASAQVGPRRRRFDQSLLAVQTAFAVGLLSAAVLLGAVFLKLVSADTGMRTGDVIQTTVNLYKASGGSVSEPPPPGQARAIFSAVEQALRQIPTVTAVAQVDLIPFAMRPSIEPVLIGNGPTTDVSVRRVSSEYFNLLEIALRRGELFTEGADLEAHPTTAVASEKLLRLHPGADLGTVVRIGPLAVRVVGIVEDVRDSFLDDDAQPTLYLPYTDVSYRRYAGTRGFLVAGGIGAGVTIREAVQGVVRQFAAYGDQSRPAALDSSIAPSLRAPRLHAWSAVVVGTTAALVLVVGTLSITWQMVRGRRKEIAIRVACGATPLSITQLLSLGIVLPVVGGTLVGAMTARPLVRALASAVNDQSAMVATAVGSTGVAVIVGVGAIAMGIAYRQTRMSVIHDLK